MASSMRNSYVGLLLLLLPCCILAVQVELAKGKKFILGFTENGMATPQLYVVTDHEAVNVTVTMPLYNATFKVTDTVFKGATLIIDLVPGICGSGTEKAQKGVLVTATNEVSIYPANVVSQSVDSYLAVPVDALGKRYYAMTSVGSPVLLIVATEDNTKVRITCPVYTGGNCVITSGLQTTTNGNTMTVRLDRYETFHAFLDSPTADFSGVYIESNRPVSVISGNRMVMPGAEHLTEQMPPVNRWGTHFNTPSTPNRQSFDLFKILASRDDTMVIFHNGTYQTIDEGEFLPVIIPSGDYQAIRTSRPVLMAMISQRWFDGAGGDPFMTIINPMRHYSTVVQWSTITREDGSEYNNTVNVIVAQNELSNLLLDGYPVDWLNETAVLGSANLVHAWTNVTNGAHDLRHPNLNVTFLAVASGQFADESYGNPTAGTAHVCQITDDPNLLDFAGERASIPFPCQYHMSYMRFVDLHVANVFDVTEFEVDISACNGLTPTNGRYYVEAILISVTFVMFNGDRVHVGNFSTDRPTIEANILKAPLPNSFWQFLWGTDDQALRDEIEFGDVTSTGKVQMSFRRVSLVLEFQPYNYQGSRPGLFVEVGNDAIIDDSAKFPATMCSTLYDMTPKVLTGWDNTVSPSDAGLYAAIKQPMTQLLGSVIGKVMCTEVKDEYDNCSPIERNYALGNCSLLVSNAGLLRCASEFVDLGKNINIDQRGFGIFQNCFKAFCQPSQRENSCSVIDSFKAQCKNKLDGFDLSICPVGGGAR